MPRRTKQTDSKERALKRVLKAVGDSPGINASDLAKKLKINRNTLYDYVYCLESRGELETFKLWRNRHLALPGEMPENIGMEPETGEEEGLFKDPETGIGFEVEKPDDTEDENDEEVVMAPRQALFRVLEIKDAQRRLLEEAGVWAQWSSLEEEAKTIVKGMPNG